MERESMEARMEVFLEWLQVRNYAERTILNHRRSLVIFFAWCKEREIISPSEVTRQILERYQNYLFHYRNERTGRPLSFRSQGVRISSIRAFFKWLARQNYILYNPASEMELPRGEKRLPKHVLTVSEAEKVLNQPDVSEPLGLRDRAILETFYSTGIRRTELTKLKVFDLDLDRGTLMIRQGKGRKDRIVPIGDRASGWMEKYIYDVRPTFVVPPDTGILFLTNTGKPLVPKRLGELVHNYVDEANIGKEGSCHLFRHTMATLMLENGADIRFIQQMLGHENLETTEIYTHVSISKLKEIHTQTHPAKLKKTDYPYRYCRLRDKSYSSPCRPGKCAASARRRTRVLRHGRCVTGIASSLSHIRQRAIPAPLRLPSSTLHNVHYVNFPGRRPAHRAYAPCAPILPAVSSSLQKNAGPPPRLKYPEPPGPLPRPLQTSLHSFCFSFSSSSLAAKLALFD